MLSHEDIRKKVEHYFIFVLLMVALLYGISRAYPLLRGPQITIYNPQDGDTVKKGTFELSGKVSRVKEITVQGRPIPIGVDGHFTEVLLSTEPYTLIIIRATDFYGKTKEETLRVLPEK